MCFLSKKKTKKVSVQDIPVSPPSIHTLEDFSETTKKVYQIDFPVDTIISDPDGWAKLADLWEDYETYPFHKAVSYIKYAYDFDCCNPLREAFLFAVCRELCSDGPAGRAWRKHDFFKRALEEAEPEDDHAYLLRLFSNKSCRISGQHCYYLEQRMMLRYYQEAGGSIKERVEASNYISAYEGFISKLSPATSGWTSECWIDINHIYDAIQHEHEENYRFSPREYDVLISLFRMEISTYILTSDREHDFLRCIFNLERFSMRWAQVLWPSNAEKNILKMYFLAKDFVDNDCAFEDILWPCHIYDVDDRVFSHSWIYSVVQNWIDTGELHTRYEKDYKRAMFEIRLGI